MEQQWQPMGSKSTWDDLSNDITRRDNTLVLAHLPDLLIWLQDLNWPGARRIAEYLVGIGAPLVPHVRTILQGTDREWQYWVLLMIVDRWPVDLVAGLEPELSALARLDTRAEVDVMALAQLLKCQMGDPSTLQHLAEHKRIVYRSTPYLLDWLNEVEPSA